MTRTEQRVPFPSPDTLVVTDGGLETWLLFDRGIDLPAFAAYPLAGTAEGRAELVTYYGHYVDIAERAGAALVLETPTWRANPDWAETLGHDRRALAQLIEASVAVVHDVRSAWMSDEPFLVSGAVGPRGDGYLVGDAMDAGTAAAYHSFQIECLATAGADVATAMTLSYVDEAIGIARAAQLQDLPVVLSFTVETDGRLPSGMPLGEAISRADDATGGYALHYMVNCAHPTHFDHALEPGAPWTARIGGLRANASTLSHAEIDNAAELDAGDPEDLADRYVGLRATLPALHVLGGCCGTDHRHVGAITSAFAASFR